MLNQLKWQFIVFSSFEQSTLICASVWVQQAVEYLMSELKRTPGNIFFVCCYFGPRVISVWRILILRCHILTFSVLPFIQMSFLHQEMTCLVSCTDVSRVAPVSISSALSADWAVCQCWGSALRVSCSKHYSHPSLRVRTKYNNDP